MAGRFGMTVASVLAAAVLGLGGAGPSAASATFVIDTTAAEVGDVFPFGNPDPANTVIYGQTVLVPEGFPVLTEFALRMLNEAELSFRGAVYAYTPGALPGDPLWVGPPITLGTSGEIVTITFSPNLSLTPGTTYVIGATTLGVDQVGPGRRFNNWRIAPQTAYSDGEFVYWNQTDPGWVLYGADLSFRATFAQFRPSTSNGSPVVELIVLPPVEHSLGFNANGGACTLTNSGPIIDGVWSQVPTAEQCTRPGFTLLGWNPKPDGSDPLGFDPGGFTLMTDHNTLYAIWVPVS